MYIFFHTIVMMLYLSFLAVIGVLQGQSGVLFQTYGNIILGLSMITVLLPGANLIDRAKLASSSIFGLYGILIVNAVDTIARIMKWRPLGYEHLQAIHDNPDLWFYEYKYGFMFNDSNQNGILMVGILCLSLAILHFTGRGKMAVFLCLVLLAATFSRAAWAAGAAVVLLRLLISRPIAFRIAVACIVGTALFVLFAGSPAADLSMMSKTKIVYDIIEFMTRQPHFMLIGAGLGQSGPLLGVYGHVLPFTVLMESGIIGVSLYGTLLVVFFVKGRQFVKLYLVSVFFVSGLSSFIYLGAPCVFLPLVIIYILEQSKMGNANGPPALD